MAKVFKTSLFPLAINEVTNYLEHPPSELTISLPPVKPKAGEIFLYKPEDGGTKGIAIIIIGNYNVDIHILLGICYNIVGRAGSS